MTLCLAAGEGDGKRGGVYSIVKCLHCWAFGKEIDFKEASVLSG